MKINPTNQNNFKGLYNNKFLLKTLETVSDHSGTFIAGASFLSATILKPLAINITPDVKKENKKAFSAEAISSGIIKLIIASAISLPIEGAIKKINANPKEFLNSKTLQNLDEKNLKFISTTIKQATNFISAIPKSYATIALMPFLLSAFSKTKAKKEETKTKEPSFKGLNKAITKIIENNSVQKYAKKHSSNSNNIARNMTVATDILLAGSSVIATKKSKKIEEKTKKPLILNKIISTAISITVGCAIDNGIQKATQNSINKFIKANEKNPKLLKYLDGINTIRPTAIFALIYYFLIPILTTLASDKLSDINQNENNCKKMLNS